MEISLDAYAKINLSLDVLYKREDGYHELSMIMQQIDLKDNVTLKHNESDVIIECNNPKVPRNHKNLAYKAWETLSKRYNIKRGVYINIHKNIPVAAGLAGGSSNAAAVLVGLNKLWDLNLSQEELMNVGVEVGADVPYCIMGGTALAEGIGEKLTKIKPFHYDNILLAKPDLEVSTAYVYKNLNLKKVNNHPDIHSIIKNLDNINFLTSNMGNVLESVTISKYGIIKQIKDEMIKYGALGSLMSGSGPTVFGIFNKRKELKNCKHKLNKCGYKTYHVKARN